MTDIGTTLWNHRRKIMALGTMAYGIGRKAAYRSYKQSSKDCLGVVNFKKSTFKERFELLPLADPLGSLLVSNAPPLAKGFELLPLSDPLGALLVSIAPLTTLGISVGLQIANPLIGAIRSLWYNKDATVTAEKQNPENGCDINMLKDSNGHDIAKEITITNTQNNTSDKKLIVFYNHGNAGNFKDSAEVFQIQIKNQFKCDNANTNNYTQVKFVQLRQGFDTKNIAEKLIQHYQTKDGNNEDGNNTDYSILGFSAGCVSSIEQANLLDELKLKDTNISTRGIVLAAPVIDGLAPLHRSTIRWFTKPLEKFLFKTGILAFTKPWQWTIGDKMRLPEDLEKKTTTIQHKDDSFAQGTFLPQTELLKANFPEAEIIEISKDTSHAHNYIMFDNDRSIMHKLMNGR